MQHARVAFYQFKPGTADEVIRRAEAGMLATFRQQPGFVAYSVIKTGESSGISLSLWQSQEQAEAAVKVAASWAKENISEFVETVQNHVGDVSFFSQMGAIGS